ncbi:glycine zipper 2TM domain-containing protein [Lysobacter niastensis]|uniref:Glycine zipper 2TM domain-containing protein n=1 Tax=Lysobacter niastensis TaxID=380629 RepID=A0ABS0B2A3_9GAMM|nr:glycine zipper 2TM domain-containing protein [Lysobacter niastensis]
MKQIIVLAAALTIAACSTDPGTRDTQKESASVVAGAVIGGLVGNQFGGGTGRALMTAAGAVAGGFVGDHLFKKHAKSEYEKDAAQRALNNGASGQKVTWSDPRTHESGYFVALNTKRMTDGRLCRDFRRGLSVDGKEVDETSGTACKKSNGQWDVG